MNLHNDQCLNLRDCVGSGASAVEVVKKRENPVILDSGRPLVPSAEFASFPAPISHLVGEYLPVNERSYVATVFAGVQPITLCLSQDVGLELASCWSIGFLPPNCQWEPSDVKIDEEHPITDFKGCLELLELEDSNYCRVTINVLVVKLSRLSNDFPSALKDLRDTIEALNHHLSSVKHVVISIEEYASCCFTLNDAIDKANQGRQSVDQLKAIFEIIDDLDRCWNGNPMVAVQSLFAFYFKNEAKPASDKYLAKFVIPLTTVHARTLFDEEASKRLSSKIMWVYSLKSFADFANFDQNAPRLCHAFHFDMSRIERYQLLQLRDRLPDILCFQNNPFIERIVINSGYGGPTMQLPRFSAPLTNATPRSALIEITLTGDNYDFDLTQLNNGYFPHLAHLTVIGGIISGHFDSDNVPRLKTLRIEPEGFVEKACYINYPLVNEHTQSLIHSGLPWQLAATQKPGGWSLASYDDPISNPQDEEKKDAPPSRPFIRELMLVMNQEEQADEWLPQLNGDLPLNAAAAAQHISFTPDRVEKITAFCVSPLWPILKLKETLPGQTRILTSLVCHGIALEVDGAMLPNLQLLKMKGCYVRLSGAFPQLKRLSLQEMDFRKAWRVNAPLLESLACDQLIHADRLSLCPHLLPNLSYLRIELCERDPDRRPKIFGRVDCPGLSRVKHVVFDQRVTKYPRIEEWQLHNVSHLELAVDALTLLENWGDAVWECKTLKVHICVSDLDRLHEAGIYLMRVFPPLPLVETLTLTSEGCPVLLDSEMPELTDLTVTSPSMLGENVKCPKLRCIRFTEKLSERDKKLCLDRAIYEAIGAQPEWVYFERDSEAKRMSWGLP